MKIICTEKEEEWIKKMMLESDDCALDCHCKLNNHENIRTACKRCIEENIEFGIEGEE